MQPLLHLAGILFPHINDDARSKSHQISLILIIRAHNFTPFWASLIETIPYVELYRYNPKHLYPKLKGYGDNGQRSLKL